MVSPELAGFELSMVSPELLSPELPELMVSPELTRVDRPERFGQVSRRLVADHPPVARGLGV